MRRIVSVLTAVMLCVASFAQTGGIKATIVNRAGRVPIPNAKVILQKDGVSIQEINAGSDGRFVFEDLENGSYSLLVNNEGYLPTQVNVIVEKGLVRDLMFVTMTAANLVKEVEDDNFTEQDLLDTGYSDSPTILFGANDVYNNVAGYGFSAIRFKNRGYNSETQDVYLAGVPMNDAITGYSPYSLWSGLNEATRSKETVNGLESSDYGIGGFNGLTNITATPSSVRPGWRFSALTNSALYRIRFMATYASGLLDNGWSYAFNVSGRFGGNDWIQGVFYRNFAFYGGVEKKIGDEHSISLFTIMTPGERGTQNASTQEVYDLMGDNMYNSNWGYQDGKVRNSRVRRTFEPIVALKYDYKPTTDFKMSATLLYRTGFNGYTALDWYDAADPRPDYYRNLPSYFSMEDEDYNRKNPDKAAWAMDSWTIHNSDYANYQHVNWDRLYDVNRHQGGRSKYVLEERHVDQNDINLSGNFKWNINEMFTFKGGLNLKWNCTENYKKMNDLLGGEYYFNVDQFAERDFAANEALIQNDLDYYLRTGAAEKITTNGKYGYDYLAQIRKAGAWLNGEYHHRNLRLSASAAVGYEGFWREGLVRKGLFAGLDENGEPFKDLKGNPIPVVYDEKGNVVTSKGKSEVKNFLTYSAKLGAEYVIKGGHRIALNAGYFNDAPTFNQSFLSARTRNSIVSDLTTIKTVSTDLTYQYSNHGYNVRVTGYYTNIMDQTDLMSFYDDSQQSFTNFAMTGINERHLGIELGFRIPLFVKNLSLSGVLAYGEHVYTNNPHMTQTMDNSAAIIRDAEVPFWQSTPIFNKVKDPETGEMVWEQDKDGNYVIAGQQKHYVPSTPQLAAELAINYNIDYWFFEINGQFFGNSYLDMNPLYRTNYACKGGVDETGKIINPDIVTYMTSQEKFNPAFLLNCSVGKSWYIQRKYQLGFSLEVKNILNNKNVRTGGYEQTRLVNSYGKDRYYRFDPKYFYMTGANYMLNIYFKF